MCPSINLANAQHRVQRKPIIGRISIRGNEYSWLVECSFALLQREEQQPCFCLALFVFLLEQNLFDSVVLQTTLPVAQSTLASALAGTTSFASALESSLATLAGSTFSTLSPLLATATTTTIVELTRQQKVGIVLQERGNGRVTENGTNGVIAKGFHKGQGRHVLDDIGFPERHQIQQRQVKGNCCVIGTVTKLKGIVIDLIKDRLGTVIDNGCAQGIRVGRDQCWIAKKDTKWDQGRRSRNGPENGWIYRGQEFSRLSRV